MEHDGCLGCKYEKESPESKYCLGCKQNAIDKYSPMTNADAIRNMSDEELAEFLGEFEVCNVCKYLGDRGECELDSIFLCEKGFAVAIAKDWLQSEVKGSDV